MTPETTQPVPTYPDPHSHLLVTAARPKLAMLRGEGSWLWDEAGACYLDFIQGWAVNALGHCPPEIARALTEQASTLLTPSPAFHNLPQSRLAAKLAARSGLGRVVFTNSGAEANEAALKLVRKYGRMRKNGAHKVLVTWGAFHGRTMAMMAASGKPPFHEMFPPNYPGFAHVRFGDVAEMERAIDADTVAIFVEPIQGEAGVVVPPDGYLGALRRLADRHGLLLVFDEVQTGIGRTGTFFGHEHEGVIPDVMTLGKCLGGGVSVAAMLAKTEVICLLPGEHGSTYGGNPLAASAGLAVTEVVDDPEFLARVRERGTELEHVLWTLAARFGGSLRGRGLFWALVLDAPKARRVAALAFEHGLVVNAAQPDVLRFTPSLRVTSQEIAEAGARLALAFRDALRD